MTKITRVPGWILPVVLVAALTACGGGDARRQFGEILYSPNGEPLAGGALGPPDCDAAMARWLRRVDRDHNGTIERDELLADARRQFAAMDLDHDSFVTPPELQAYRAPFVREERGRARPPETAAGERPVPRRDAGERENRGSSDRLDPVMSADSSLRNKVSEADFLAQAERRFRLIDANHDGRLDESELVKACSVVRS
jgi:hypothetical protein